MSDSQLELLHVEARSYAAGTEVTHALYADMLECDADQEGSSSSWWLDDKDPNVTIWDALSNPDWRPEDEEPEACHLIQPLVLFRLTAIPLEPTYEPSCLQQELDFALFPSEYDWCRVIEAYQLDAVQKRSYFVSRGVSEVRFNLLYRTSYDTYYDQEGFKSADAICEYLGYLDVSALEQHAINTDKDE